MTASRAVVLALLLAGALLLAPVASGALAGAVQESDDDGDDVDGGTAEGGETNRTMGAAVTGFMQSSTADADESVDSGMFVAAYESAADDERAAVVTDRNAALERKVADFEARREALEERREGMNPVAYDARMAALAVRLSALEAAIDDAEPRAREAGADVDALEDLRSDVSALSGPEIAAAASTVPGLGPPGGQSGGERGNGPDGEAADRSPPGQANASSPADRERVGGPSNHWTLEDRGPAANDSAIHPGDSRGGPDRTDSPPS